MSEMDLYIPVRPLVQLDTVDVITTILKHCEQKLKEKIAAGEDIKDLIHIIEELEIVS